LAHVEANVQLDAGPATQRSVRDGLEARYPMQRGSSPPK
jgi:hypothetical protein